MSHVPRATFVNGKLIYVSIGRLTDKMTRDCYIDYLIEKGVTVEYWDVVSLLREEHSERGATNPPYLRILRTFDDLERAVLQPGNLNACYMMLIGYMGRFARVFRLLSKHNCRMVTFVWGLLPRYPVYRWGRMAAWFSSPYLYAVEFADRLKAVALRKLGLVKPFEIVFAAGDVSMTADYYGARVVPINYFDYDEYVRTRASSNSRLVAEPFAVFLDSNLPYHQDLVFCGYPQIDPAAYYESLNRFFGLIEQGLGVAIVIAAHPKADYPDTLFKGRKIFRLATAELIRDAEFAISHTSTAMSYAVLYEKPLMFVHTDEMAAKYKMKFMREMRCYADYLDAPLYNIDSVRETREIALRNINAERYMRLQI